MNDKLLLLKSCRTLEITFHECSIWRSHPLSLKKFNYSQLFENLNDADIDGYDCNLSSKDETSRIILFMRNHQSALFFDSELWSSVRVSHRNGNFDFCCWVTPVSITSIPMFAASRAKVDHSILFVKIVNCYFERKNFFRQGQFQSFDGSSVSIKGKKTLYLSDWVNFCSRYHNKCLRLACEKFVLASESNLSLATGLASWNVSLEPCYSYIVSSSQNRLP